jgi:Protein of unknown function (DUF3558)
MTGQRMWRRSGCGRSAALSGLAGIGLLLLGGCGGGDGPGSGPSSPGPSSPGTAAHSNDDNSYDRNSAVSSLTKDPCSLVTDSEVAKVLGSPVSHRARTTSDGNRQCDWLRQGNGVDLPDVSIAYEPQWNVPGYKQMATAPVPGQERLDIGDGAVLESGDITVLIGNAAFHVTRPTGGLPTSAAIPLAKAAASRLL